jgi:serine/threonine-protein kinase
VQPENWDRVKAIIDALCDVPREQRSRALDVACAGDDVLRREVASLLDASDEAASVLESAGFTDLPAVRGPEAVLGRRIGIYEITDVIASGGMGTVYRAARVDGQIEQVVAVKFIRPGLLTPDLLDRFHRERRLLAVFDHPHIARLLDGGVTEDGQPYLVMEYIQGRPIDEYCDEHRLNTVERLRLFRDVCASVQYAHQHLVVHRDLKPSNIMVTNEGQVKLLDFGIAKALTSEPPEAAADQPVTQQPLLTPEYASPEQFRGEPVTTATDVYALGVVLYRLLTGHRPYRGTSRQFQDVAMAVCREEPQRPSTAVHRAGETLRTADGRTISLTPDAVSLPREGPPWKLARRLAGDIDAIVLKALRKEPGRRYASAELFAEDIRCYLEGLPVAARRGSRWYRMAKLARRHRAALAAAAVVALSLLGGAIALIWAAEVSRHERNLALKAKEFAEREMASAIVEARKADQVIRFLQRTLSSADPAQRGHEVTVLEVLETATKTVATEFANDPEAESAVRTSIGTTLLGLGRYDEAETQLRMSLDIQRRLHRAPHGDVASALNMLGVLLYSKGDSAGAEQCCNEALAIQRMIYGDEHPDVATSLNNLGVLVRLRGDPVRSEELLREALRIRRAQFGDEHLDVAETLNNLAILMQRLRRPNEAEPLHRQALAIRRKLLPAEHPLVAQSLDNLATVLLEQGHLPESEQLMREALAVYRGRLGDGHPDLAITLQNLGELLVSRGAAAEAEPLLRETLAIRRQSLPEKDPRTADTMARLGRCLALLQRYEEAESLLLEGYATLREVAGPTHGRTQLATQFLVSLYTDWGKPKEAEQYSVLLSTPPPPKPSG